MGRACQAFVFVAGDLAISPESAQHQRAKARERVRKVVKAAWISGSRAKVSLSREDGVGMGSLGLPITDLGRATSGKVVVGNIRRSVGCVGKLVTRRQSAAGRGVEAGGVEAEEEEVVADVGGGLDDCFGREREDKGERVSSTNEKGGGSAKAEEVAFVHQNKFGVLEVDCGDLAVYAVEASAQVHELDVAHVSTEITIDSAAEESVCPQKWAESFGVHAVDRLLKLVNASGGRIEHFGKRAVSFNPENCDGGTMEAKFEVTNVRKPLMAVARVVDAGNVVQFGPRPEDNFIMHVGSNDKVYLRRKGNSFVFEGRIDRGSFETARRCASKLAGKTIDVEAVGGEAETRDETDGGEVDDDSDEQLEEVTRLGGDVRSTGLRRT